MGFEYATDAQSMAVGEVKKFKINGRDLLLIRLDDGFYATQTQCPHLFAPLEKGKVVDGERLQCRFHRAEFDIRTGEVCKWASFPPGIQALNVLRGEKCLTTFETKEEDGNVYVEV